MTTKTTLLTAITAATLLLAACGDKANTHTTSQAAQKSAATP